MALEIKAFFHNEIMSWVWFLGATVHSDGTATITLHDRRHYMRHSENMPDSKGRFELIETGDRQLSAVKLFIRGENTARTCAVRNVAHVFSYPKFPPDKD